MVDVVDQLLAHSALHQRTAGYLLGPLAVGLPSGLKQCDVVDGYVGLALGADAAGELRAAADGAPLVIELPGCHVPAAVDFADDGIVTEFEVVEELLAELDRSVDLLDATQGDAGAVDGHHEHRQALVLGHIPVSAGQHQAVVGGESAGAPRLRAVDHPLVALSVGPGDDTRQIRSAAGLR